MNNQLLALALAVLAAVLPFVRSWALAKFTPQRVNHVMDIARVAVTAAAKLGKDLPGTTGAAKLNFASEIVVAGAKRVGVKLTQDEVLAFVHAALSEVQKVDYSTLPSH